MLELCQLWMVKRTQLVTLRICACIYGRARIYAFLCLCVKCRFVWKNWRSNCWDVQNVVNVKAISVSLAVFEDNAWRCSWTSYRGVPAKPSHPLSSYWFFKRLLFRREKTFMRWCFADRKTGCECCFICSECFCGVAFALRGRWERYFLTTVVMTAEKWAEYGALYNAESPLACSHLLQDSLYLPIEPSTKCCMTFWTSSLLLDL